MFFQPGNRNGYQILRVFQDTFGDGDASTLLSQLGVYLDKGIDRIAVAFNESVYPHSKLISLMMQCYRLVNGRGGTLVFIQPNETFVKIANSLNLSVMMRIVASEDDL
jgi:hypothetical protein